MLRACTRSNSFAVDMTKWVPAIVITAAKVLLFHDPTKQISRKCMKPAKKCIKCPMGHRKTIILPTNQTTLQKRKICLLRDLFLNSQPWSEYSLSQHNVLSVSIINYSYLVIWCNNFPVSAFGGSDAANNALRL